MIALLLYLTLCAGPASQDLVVDGFGTKAVQWTRHPLGLPVGFFEKDQPELHISVKEAQEPDWRQLYRAIPAQPGEAFRAQVEARGAGVRDGIGAILSLTFMGEDQQRITSCDTILGSGLGGTWTPLSVRGDAPEGTAEVRLVLLFHGRGEAVFREPRLWKVERGTPDSAPNAVTVTVSKEKTCDVVGWGFEDDGWFYNEDNAKRGADAAAIALREKRLRWLQPDYMRMFFWYKDFNPSLDGATFTWDSDNMRSHYKSLDVYQALGTRTNICFVEWGIPDPWQKEDLLLALQAALLDHLVHEKGYTCIRDWTLTNEPNLFFGGMAGSFEQYKRLHHRARALFKEKGLKLNCVGSDDGDGQAWFNALLQDGAYTKNADLFASHFYLSEARRAWAGEILAERVTMLKDGAGAKPFIVGEFGLQDHRTQPPFFNPYMRDYPCALWTQFCFIAGLNAGVAGFSTWCVQEMYYPGSEAPMVFGLWDFADRDWRVRPVYHVVGAFCRELDPGDAAWKTASSAPQAIAAATAGDTLFWVNLAEKAVSVTIEGFSPSTVRIMTAENLEGDETCGDLVELDGRATFEAPPKSFGFAKRKD